MKQRFWWRCLNILWLTSQQGAWAAPSNTIKSPGTSWSHTWCLAPASTGPAKDLASNQISCSQLSQGLPLVRAEGEVRAKLWQPWNLSSAFSTPRETWCRCLDHSSFPFGLSSGPHSSEHGNDLLNGRGEVWSIAVSPSVVKPSPVRLDRMRRRSPKCGSPPQGMPLDCSGTQPGCVWLVCSTGPAGRLEAVRWG